MRTLTLFTLAIAAFLTNGGCVTEPTREPTLDDTALVGDGDAARDACYQTALTGYRACDAAYLPRLSACRPAGNTDPGDVDVKKCIERELTTLQACNAGVRDALTACLAAIPADNADDVADEGDLVIDLAPVEPIGGPLPL